MKLLLGSDPEAFVLSKKRDVGYISAHGLIKGTKSKPHKVKKGAIQVDGMAVEFNTDPAATYAEWERNHTTVISELIKAIGATNKLDFTPTVHFSKAVIDAAPDEAKVLGCEPDYNAWTSKENTTPNADDTTLRTGAGHIHFGWTDGIDEEGKPFDPSHPEHVSACEQLTKMLDNILAPLSLLWDDNTERRTLYGSLGAYRPKPYGMEYRVLSNAWVDSPQLRKVVYDVSTAVFNHLLSESKKGYKMSSSITLSALTPLMEGDYKAAYKYVSSVSHFNMPDSIKDLYREKVSAASRARGTYKLIGENPYDVVVATYECAEEFKVMELTDNGWGVKDATVV